MGKKRRLVGQPSPRAKLAPTPSPALTRPQVLRRALLGLAVSACLLLLAEGVLRVCGYGYPTCFFVKGPEPGTLIPNRCFAWRFMSRETATQPWPLLLSRQKQPGACRIFFLGESAAQGTPAPAFGCARILEVMLNGQFPNRRFEVVNVAMRGINSHAVRLIARECAALQPDLFLVYMGNNEVIGLYAPEPGRFTLTPYRRILRASQWLRATRLAQLLENGARALRKRPPRHEQDMAFFRKTCLLADAPERRAVYDNFRANLDDILDIVQASGAKTVLSTVAVNLQDFPPLASRHRPGLAGPALAEWEGAFARGTNAEGRGLFAEAIPHYQEALRLDDHFAELHFRLARSYLARRELEPARRHFELARDWDALQFRADSRLNESIRQAAGPAGRPDLTLVDAERAFAEEAARTGNLPGNGFFHEHVHLTFDGDYLLARAFRDAVVMSLGLTEPVPARPLPSRRECAEALAFSEWDELGVQAAMTRATGHAPFLDQLEHEARQRQAEARIQQLTERFHQLEVQNRSREMYRSAFGRRPDDWQMHFNYGNLLGDFNRISEAAVEYATAVKWMPVFPALRMSLANTLWKTGDKQAAVEQIRAALSIDPDYPPAREALARAGFRR